MMNFKQNIPKYTSKVLEINLTKISNNYKLLSDFVHSTTCAAVLKANAYGYGVKPILKTLINSGCRDFFFAFLDEAMEARSFINNWGYRDENIKLYVFNGVFPGTEDLFLQYNIIPCLISTEQIERWSNYSKKINQKLPCLLHVDTGLGREGLSLYEFDKLLNNTNLLNNIQILYLMSHLVHSSIINEPSNELQLAKFKQFHTNMPNLKCSFAHSAGAALGKTYQHDMVRIGMALYGYKSLHYRGVLKLQTSIKAYARILRTRTVPTGQIVGYDGTHICQQETKIALVAAGHADGIFRTASNKGSIRINGRTAAILGIVSMDVMMVDISDHPVDSVQADMWAELYSDADSAKNFAISAGSTIYELFARQGNRYYRIYNN